MHAIVITANDVVARIDTRCPGSQPIPVQVIMHEMEYMARPDVIETMIYKWKETYHPSERPIDNSWDDALEAFCQWLGDQKELGFVIPVTSHSLFAVPIFDTVDA